MASRSKRQPAPTQATEVPGKVNVPEKEVVKTKGKVSTKSNDAYAETIEESAKSDKRKRKGVASDDQEMEVTSMNGSNGKSKVEVVALADNKKDKKRSKKSEAPTEHVVIDLIEEEAVEAPVATTKRGKKAAVAAPAPAQEPQPQPETTESEEIVTTKSNGKRSKKSSKAKDEQTAAEVVDLAPVVEKEKEKPARWKRSVTQDSDDTSAQQSSSSSQDATKKSGASRSTNRNAPVVAVAASVSEEPKRKRVVQIVSDAEAEWPAVVADNTPSASAASSQATAKQQLQPPKPKPVFYVPSAESEQPSSEDIKAQKQKEEAVARGPVGGPAVNFKELLVTGTLSHMNPTTQQQPARKQPSLRNTAFQQQNNSLAPPTQVTLNSQAINNPTNNAAVVASTCVTEHGGYGDRVCVSADGTFACVLDGFTRGGISDFIATRAVYYFDDLLHRFAEVSTIYAQDVANICVRVRQRLLTDAHNSHAFDVCATGADYCCVVVYKPTLAPSTVHKSIKSHNQPRCYIGGNVGCTQAYVCRNGTAVCIAAPTLPKRAAVSSSEAGNSKSQVSISRPTLECDLTFTITEAHPVEDEFLLLASDGLFDVFAPQEAVDFVRTYVKRNGSADAKSSVSRLLIEEGQKRNAPDNLSTVVMWLQHNT